MVNHFASLLSNLNLSTPGPSEQPIFLGGEIPIGESESSDPTFLLSDESGIPIFLGGELSSFGNQIGKAYCPLVYRQYIAIPLPPQLQKFHSVLFPESASFFYKQYLLYSYLKLISATDWANHVGIYDSRITYNLSDIKDYFKFFRKSEPVSNNSKYKMLLIGNIKSEEDVAGAQNNFIVKQAPNPQNLLVYSLTQKKYYKQGKESSSIASGMDTPVELATPTTSKIIQIGDTGLSFYITGQLGATPSIFSEDNNIWSFSAEAPLIFDYSAKINELNVISSVVEDMLEYGRASCNTSYENLWKTHYNIIYRFAGLLLAYVERVNILWQKRQM